MATQTRGVRNNNPGNIDRSPNNKWQGRMPRERMTAAQRDEKRFEVFSTAAWGIRAMAVLLITYFDRHGCNTVEKIIDRWAPPVENNTRAYINAVADAIGVKPGEFINLHEFRRMHPLVVAIIAHENAGYRYPPEVVEEGLRLAGVVKPNAPMIAKPAIVQKATITALSAGGGAALVEGVNEMLPMLSAVSQVNSVTSGLPPLVRGIALVLVAVSVGASIYALIRLRRASKAVSA